MLLVFLIFGLVMIGLVTYGFAVVNKQPTKSEGPTYEDEVNKLTDAFNVSVKELKTNYLGLKENIREKEALTQLKADVTSSYNFMRENYNRQVDAVKAPRAKKNPVRAFWNKVCYGGILASLTGCFGSACYLGCSEDNEPKKEVNTETVWSADNIPMPHLEDENQYVANPDKVLGKGTVDSMNVILRKMDTETDIETAIVAVNHCKGGDAYRLAQDMGNKYGVGRNNRGLVVVMAYGDHDINISPGSGLESTLTDGKCGRLLDEYAVPYLKKEQPDSAMLYLIRALSEVVRDQDELSPVYEKPMSDEEREAGESGMGFLGLTGLIALLRRKLNKKGLLQETAPSLKIAMPNPTIEMLGLGAGGLAAGSVLGSSRRDRDDDRRRRRSSWSGGSSTRRGSYGGGHFGGGGASRKW